jgi:SAM-dependent methyltransferase
VAGTVQRLSELFERSVAGVSEEIAHGDEMFTGNREHYLGVGRSALRCIELALLAARRPPREVKSILDLPSGHGRVLRVLRAAFPEASITACDLVREAVDHCAAAFGARPVYSTRDLRKLELPGRFDLIWCGSLFTHLDEPRWIELLDLLAGSLEPRGVLVFTVHGRATFERVRTGWDYGLPVEELRRLADDFERRGFGYADYAGQPGFGISVSRRAFVLALLERHPELRVLGFTERGWDDHQDVVACGKDLWEAPPGPNRSLRERFDRGR